MDCIKELFSPNAFNRISHVGVVIWFMMGVIFLGIFSDMENTEGRLDFHCDAAELENLDDVRKRCFEKYKKENNKYGFPPYGFVIINYFLIAFVCVIYHRLVRRTIVHLSPDTRYRDPEIQPLDQENPTTNRYKLFVAFCCQLFTRLVLHVLFMVLQTQFLYSSKFSSGFYCHLTSETSQPNASSNAVQTSTFHECHNQRAQRKNFWLKAVLAVNGILVALILIETVYILLRAWKQRSFMENSKFLRTHLNPSYGMSHQRPQRQERRTEHETVPLQSRECESRPTQGDNVLSRPRNQIELHPEPRRPNGEVEGRSRHRNPERLRRFIEQTKKIIKSDTRRLPELHAPFAGPPGEPSGAREFTMDEIYTKFVVIPNRAIYNFTADRQQQLHAYTRSREESQPKSLEDLLDVNTKKVLIVGRPGIGKTFCCTKFFRDWAFDQVFKIHFDVAFLVRFKRFDSSKELSLRELLTLSEHSPSDHLDDEVWKYILQHPEGVLIIFEGFDQFKYNANMVASPFRPGSVEEKMPFQILYQWLVTGRLLEDASVVTTTRPTALSSISHLTFDKTFEILGFSSEQIEEYVRKFAGDDKQTGELLWRHISSDINLLSFCYVPLHSFIMCSIVWQILMFNRSAEVNVPSLLVKVYKIAMKLLYYKHTKGFREKYYSRGDFESDDLPTQVEEKFRILGRVAFEGINEGQPILGGNEVDGVEDSVFFHRLPNRLTAASEQEEQFCFIHLTIQEFFAARHLATTMNETELRNFISENNQDGRWQLVFRFLAGLLVNH